MNFPILEGVFYVIYLCFDLRCYETKMLLESVVAF